MKNFNLKMFDTVFWNVCKTKNYKKCGEFSILEKVAMHGECRPWKSKKLACVQGNNSKLTFIKLDKLNS